MKDVTLKQPKAKSSQSNNKAKPVRSITSFFTAIPKKPIVVEKKDEDENTTA